MGISRWYGLSYDFHYTTIEYLKKKKNNEPNISVPPINVYVYRKKKSYIKLDEAKAWIKKTSSKIMNVKIPSLLKLYINIAIYIFINMYIVHIIERGNVEQGKNFVDQFFPRRDFFFIVMLAHLINLHQFDQNSNSKEYLLKIWYKKCICNSIKLFHS